MVSNDLIIHATDIPEKERSSGAKKKKKIKQLKVPNLLKLTIFQKEGIKHQIE